MRRTERIVALCALAVLSACRVAPPPKPQPPVEPTPVPTPQPPPDVSKIPDAVPKTEPRSRRGNPPFYEVYGKRYHVLASSTNYRERGVASWYGKDFHGGPTSNGEKYDMYAMTAAHKTLPLPTYVEVVNLKNGKTTWPRSSPIRSRRRSSPSSRSGPCGTSN